VCRIPSPNFILIIKLLNYIFFNCIITEGNCREAIRWAQEELARRDRIWLRNLRDP